MRTDPSGDAVQEEVLHAVMICACDYILIGPLNPYMMSRLHMICGIGDARYLLPSNPQYEVEVRECRAHPFPGS